MGEVKFDCSTKEIVQREYTQEELQEMDNKRKLEELNYTVIEDRPTQSEIEFAEYILYIESELENIKKQVGGI